MENNQNINQEESFEVYQKRIEEEFAAKTGVTEQTPLGKIDISDTLGLNDTRMTEQEVIDVQSTIGGGWFQVRPEQLPSKGMFYPDNCTIEVRAARVDEIRDFSTMDETDAENVESHISAILSSCVRMRMPQGMQGYNDIQEMDKLALLIRVRDYTFVHHENVIMLPVTSRTCPTTGCGGQTEVERTADILQFEELPSDIMKYYDATMKCFNVRTKSYGNIVLYAPTIGVLKAIRQYIAKHPEASTTDLSVTQMLPFMFINWRNATDIAIRQACLNITSWPASKFSLVFRLVELISEATIGIKSQFTMPCDAGDGEVTIEFTFQDGLRNLFIPTLHSLADELL